MLNISIKVTDSATPALAMLDGALKDRTPLNKSISGTVEEITRGHIRIAAQTRHKTASRLGAAPTGYLSALSESIESTADAAGVTLSVYGSIFKRVTGPVAVAPVNKKWLTIPATARAYGRRAGEFGNLEFRRNKSGGARLVDADGDVLFWLVKAVTLPQDRGLLPSDEQYRDAAELGARNYLNQQIASASGGAAALS